ncbi:MAG: Maf-like protein [Aliihoeflea sp.]
MSEPFILASASPFRRDMLVSAGLEFEVQKAQTNERAVEAGIEGAGLEPAEIATILAEAKAIDVSERNSGRLVIGCDQVLALDGEILHKCSDMEQARRRLLALSGRTHQLHSAIVAVIDGVTAWRHVSTANMTMRRLEPAYIGRHLARTGEKVLGSVGAYQIEGEGVQLFDRIDGDHFTIIGLPLLPLLAFLRERGQIDG